MLACAPYWSRVVWNISRMKNTYLSAQYHRLARRLGKLKAAIAVAHSLLVIIYHILRDKKPYRDLGADYFGGKLTEGWTNFAPKDGNMI
jgi:hypothetical protein